MQLVSFAKALILLPALAAATSLSGVPAGATAPRLPLIPKLPQGTERSFCSLQPPYSTRFNIRIDTSNCQSEKGFDLQLSAPALASYGQSPGCIQGFHLTNGSWVVSVPVGDGVNLTLFDQQSETHARPVRVNSYYNATGDLSLGAEPTSTPAPFVVSAEPQPCTDLDEGDMESCNRPVWKMQFNGPVGDAVAQWGGDENEQEWRCGTKGADGQHSKRTALDNHVENGGSFEPVTYANVFPEAFSAPYLVITYCAPPGSPVKTWCGSPN
ncbi:uncharacterized protein PFL1_05034 [Pseudozyma flocculosa PF-1]|uniref:Ubiquitin 3 binding protein But2 C-terminal domain-containing protein n=1 Tax=Pseudozyma flocculosa PF-1 TaxID=1277687 RepID=A0A061HAA2_9BASI|nr:uncharacterized protein PFL1_05034 [Pseudozyma flocculosa PF-1]EPQ27496.1 hypothetical protein PFL1_05034 [Pseudozyma flocculosa PF-1]